MDINFFKGVEITIIDKTFHNTSENHRWQGYPRRTEKLKKINKIKTKHKSLVKKDKNKTTGEQTKRPKRT